MQSDLDLHWGEIHGLYIKETGCRWLEILLSEIQDSHYHSEKRTFTVLYQWSDFSIRQLHKCSRSNRVLTPCFGQTNNQISKRLKNQLLKLFSSWNRMRQQTPEGRVSVQSTNLELFFLIISFTKTLPANWKLVHKKLKPLFLSKVIFLVMN